MLTSIEIIRNHTFNSDDTIVIGNARTKVNRVGSHIEVDGFTRTESPTRQAHPLTTPNLCEIWGEDGDGKLPDLGRSDHDRC